MLLGLARDMRYRERLAHITTTITNEWWGFTIGYPIARRLVGLLGDVRAITPNRVSIVSVLCAVTGAGMLLLHTTAGDIACAVFLQLHLILDCVDGTLARYRKTMSLLGSFLDKIGDLIGFVCVGCAVGYRAYHADGLGSGEPWIVAAGGLGAGCYGVVCYMYWLVAYHELEKTGPRTIDNIGRTTQHARTGIANRLLFQLKGQWRILQFNALDFTLWVPLLVLLGRSDVAVLMVLITQATTMAKKLIQRGQAMAALDRAVGHGSGAGAASGAEEEPSD